MSAFLTALFIIVFFVLAIILLGLYLMSKMVGGFGNLRAIYRLFTGKGKQGARQQSAKSSSSGSSSRSVHIIITVKRTQRMPKHQEKCLGRMKVRMWSLRR